MGKAFSLVPRKKRDPASGFFTHFRLGLLWVNVVATRNPRAISQVVESHSSGLWGSLPISAQGCFR